MRTADAPEHARRRRQVARLGLLRQRAAVASALGFAAFLGLAAQHAVGSGKRRATAAVTPRSATPTAYFDQQSDGYAFDDGQEASPLPDGGSSPAPPPPVAQTSVS